MLVVVRGAVAEETRKLDARWMYERGVSKNLRLEEGAIVLERGQLYEDDGPAAGYSYRPNLQRLSTEVWARKTLVVPRPEAAAATLLLAPGGELQLRVNGRPAPLKNPSKIGGYWQAYQLDPSLLRRGENRFDFSGDGSLWIARDDEFALGSATLTSGPNRSAKSNDGGQTWDDERLGAEGDVDGEYYVRLFLDQYAARGELTLPVADSGCLAGDGLPRLLEDVGPIRLKLSAEAGEGASVSLRVRSGTTFVPTEETWSAWETLSTETSELADPRGRYFQVSLRLQSDDPLRTPKVRELSLESAAKSAADDWTRDVRRTASDNPPVIRSSIPFDYEPFDHPRLNRLREEYRLDEVVRGAESELETITRLAAWSSGLWKRGHLKDVYPGWDALDILRPHDDGAPVGGFCLQYNLVFLQACESFGLAGRILSIGPSNQLDLIRGGHEVAEIWSNDHRKWVYVDGQKSWYFADEETDEPLSLLELRQRQLRALAGKPHAGVRLVRFGESSHPWEDFTGWPPFMEVRLVPRSNFLQQSAPLPLNQGMRGWFWTGHCVWTDELLEARPIYSRRVSRRGNFEWALNQAFIWLEPTKKPGELRVHLDGETPGFETYQARIDDGGWRDVAPVFPWRLRPGPNRLETASKNSAGRRGATSSVSLQYEP